MVREPICTAILSSVWYCFSRRSAACYMLFCVFRISRETILSVEIRRTLNMMTPESRNSTTKYMAAY